MFKLLQKFVVLSAVVMVVGLSYSYAAEQQKQLTGDDLKMATQMNAMYARHMYSSICVGNESAVMPIDLPPAEKTTRMASYKKSCDCLTDIMLKSYSPNEVIEFITQTTGINTANKKPLTPQQDDKIGKMMMVSFGEDNRKKCGFKQQ